MQEKLVSVDFSTNDSVASNSIHKLMPEVSVVIPMYNEQDNIKLLYTELNPILESLAVPYEVLVVDDGSVDQSFQELQQIHSLDPRWRIIRFRRNFGQTAAIMAGFDLSRGEFIVTLDADLQNDPHDIPKLLDKMREGYDIVSGWRTKRKEPFFSRRLPSMLANTLISRMTRVRLHDYGCTLKVYHRDVVKNIMLYGELHRFIPAIASWMGVLVAEVPVNDRPRLFGRSKYGIGRTIRVVVDLMAVLFFLSFSTRPLHIFGRIGLGLVALGTIFGAYLVYAKLVLFEAIGDRPLLIATALFILVGVQLIGIGFVAEFVMRTYHEPQGRKTYAIRQRLDVEDELPLD